MKKEIKAPAKSRKPINMAKKLDRLIDKLQEKTPLHYTMTGSFNKDDIINHDTFGKGVVIDTYYRKIDVLFSERVITLVCSR